MENPWLAGAREQHFDWNLSLFDEFNADVPYLEDHCLFHAFAQDWSSDNNAEFCRVESTATSHEASSDDEVSKDNRPSPQPTLTRCTTTSDQESEPSHAMANSVWKDDERTSNDKLQYRTEEISGMVTKAQRETRSRPQTEENPANLADGPWVRPVVRCYPSTPAGRPALTGRRKATEEAREVLMDWLNANRGRSRFVRRIGSAPHLVVLYYFVWHRSPVPVARAKGGLSAAQRPLSAADRALDEQRAQTSPHPATEVSCLFTAIVSALPMLTAGICCTT
jgi:hypothetical protein